MRLATIGLFTAMLLFAPVFAEAPKPASPAWMQVEETVLPLKENTTRNAAILGLARKGDVLAVIRTGDDWVKVRLNDTLTGWVPVSAMSPSGPPVRLNPGYVKTTVFVLAGLGLAAFLAMALFLHGKRRAESRERARQSMADAKRRLQNKIQLLFPAEPRIRSHLVTDEMELRGFLQGIGYIANLEKEPDRFMASCKAFRPNLILAGFAFHDQVETLVETDAMLINTPVIYMECGAAPDAPGNRVRAYLETNASEKDLGSAITQCLRRSPDTILYSVKPMALKGAIQPGTLMDLLHFLAAVKKSGRLLVVSGTAKGEIRMRNGEISLSSMGGLAGARAAEEVLDLTTGSFEFHEQTETAAGVMTIAGETTAGEGPLNTEKILMDWAKNKDESNHHTRS